MDGQGPPALSDNFVRPPFDDRPGPRRGMGPGPGPRFRGDRTRDRQTRWSNEESKEPPRSEPERKDTKPDMMEENNKPEQPTRDSSTPVHDEMPGEEPLTEPTQSEPQSEPEPQRTEYERDTQTPCHDEPEVPDIVTEKDDAPAEAEA